MRRVFATVCLAAVFAVPLPALADTGMAYDSVNRIVMNADPSAMQPGPFDQDFAAASATPSPAGGGGLFGHLKQQIAMAANAGQMMSTGIAQRHYVAGSKSRTDMVSLGVATITDCAARTITTLNLRDKTYRIESMDHPSTGSGGATGTGGTIKDDGTRVAIAIQNRSLGSEMLAGQHTTGYRSTMSITESKPGSQAQTQHMDLMAYYSGLRTPLPTCFRFGTASAMSPGNAMAMMGAAMHAMQALSVAGIDKRFSLSQSGPPLPAGNLAMWEAIFFGDKGTAFVTEVGNVRPIDANDPIFSIPPDFTKA